MNSFPIYIGNDGRVRQILQERGVDVCRCAYSEFAHSLIYFEGRVHGTKDVPNYSNVIECRTIVQFLAEIEKKDEFVRKNR